MQLVEEEADVRGFWIFVSPMVDKECSRIFYHKCYNIDGDNSDIDI